MKIVGKNVWPADREVPVNAQVLNESAHCRIKTDDASRARLDGNENAIGVDRRQSLGVKLLHDRCTETKRSGANFVIDGRSSECSVEHDARGDVATVEVGCDRARSQQLRVDCEVLEAAIRQVDEPAGIDIQRVRPELDTRIGAPLIERSVNRNIKPRRGQSLDRPLEIQTRPTCTPHAKTAVPRLQIQVGKVLAAKRCDPLAVPFGPISPAVHRQGQRLLQPGHRGNHAIGRSIDLRSDVQLVRFRNGIETQHQSVAAGNACSAQGSGIGHDLSAAIGDVDLPVDPGNAFLAAHRRFKYQSTDVQRVHVDIEVGQQGCVGIAWRRLQLRLAFHRHQVGRQTPDIDMTVDEGERTPVDNKPR